MSLAAREHREPTAELTVTGLECVQKWFPDNDVEARDQLKRAWLRPCVLPWNEAHLCVRSQLYPPLPSWHQ